jgi:rubrerythrin
MVFKMTAKMEAEQEKRYLKLRQNIEDGGIFPKDGKVFWKFRNCGYLYVTAETLEICPVSQHSKTYMELHEGNY